MEQQEHKTTQDWALYYASLGLAVVPITAGTKHPPMKAWQKEATQDPEKIRQWWSRWPDSGVGVVTGEKSGGLAVIDLDEHPEDGRRGVELLQTWERENGRLPETWTATTGSGGRHLFFKLQGSMKRQQHLYDYQVDFQTDGALVILPPTIHAKTGRPYKWDIAPDQRPLAVYDDQAAAFIDEGYLEARGSGSGPRFEAQKEVTAGGRTDYLFRMLSSLQAKGLTDAAIRAAVSAENDSVCVPPLSDQELEREVFPALQRFEKGALSGSSSQKQAKSKAPLSLDLVSLDNVPEERPDWLIPGYIPRYQITTLAGDGGSGKTTVWCNIAAAVSSGRPCFIEHRETVQREPGTVMFFSAEDSLKYTLARRLRKNGADLSRIISLDISDERFQAVKFNSDFLEQLLATYRPELCIFDPIQAFVPAEIKMGDRNAMRQCLGPLIGYGDKYGTTFMIVVHTNKQSGVYSRRRIADSADIWDSSRSVLIVGDTGDGQQYLAHEKANYSRHNDTVLFSLDDEVATFRGTSELTDRDYVLKAQYSGKAKPQRENAKDLIIDLLETVIVGDENTEFGRMETADLDALLKQYGVSKNTAARAKSELIKEGKIKAVQGGFGKDKKWFTVLCPVENG
ncbi:MAG: bifunctional DNA primase/polymerase [Oscillospiraceae bacterium]|nr:bifunctional DNA primase/polymerase [Oscillospiraceae bacterium]